MGQITATMSGSLLITPHGPTRSSFILLSPRPFDNKYVNVDSGCIWRRNHRDLTAFSRAGMHKQVFQVASIFPLFTYAVRMYLMTVFLVGYVFVHARFAFGVLVQGDVEHCFEKYLPDHEDADDDRSRPAYRHSLTSAALAARVYFCKSQLVLLYLLMTHWTTWGVHNATLYSFCIYTLELWILVGRSRPVKLYTAACVGMLLEWLFYADYSV